MPDKVEAQVDRYAYGKNRPGNASVAYVAETQLRDIKKTLPLRVLSQDDWKHWTTRGYVVVKQAVPPENVKRLVDLLWKFQEMNPADPNTWYKGQLRDHAMKELNNSGMVEIYNHQCLWDNRQHPRVHAGSLGQQGHEVTDRMVLAAEQVTPSRSAMLGRQQMAPGRVAHIDQVPAAA